MFALLGLLPLIATIHIRPQEMVPALQSVPLLAGLLALSVVGLAVDIRIHAVRPERSPLLGWALAFMALGLLSVATHPSGAVGIEATASVVACALCLLPAHAVQNRRAFALTAATVLGAGALLTVVALSQRAAPMQCILVDDRPGGDATVGRPDGRLCGSRADCFRDSPEPGGEYLCERVGWLGTTTVGGGRVRYRGVVEDPNELAVVATLTIPLAFAFFQSRRSVLRAVLAVAVLAAAVAADLLTRSRSGQLALLTVLGAYLFRRYRWRGLVAAAAIMLPPMLFAMRGGEEAAASASERIECWIEGLRMVRAHPLAGVGKGQFVEYHYLTAHNSVVLALAELGPLGLFLWTGVFHTCASMLLAARRALGRGAHAAFVEPWSAALLAGLGALAVAGFFLSLTYHVVLWIWFGLCGAFIATLRTELPSWKWQPRPRTLATIAAIDATLVAAIIVYVRLRS